MQSRHFWFFLLLLLLATTADAAIDLDREMILTPVADSSGPDQEIARWQRRVAGEAATAADYERLGWAFEARARRTLDPAYYKLAEKTADVMEARFGTSASAELLRGHVDHNLHRFRSAETIARQLVATRGMPEDYALLSDALMEQGKLAPAIDALQHFANLKPGAEADTRIAHIRWLKGDLRGAIVAMESAVRETSPMDHEALAWMHTRLAIYALEDGAPARAEKLALAALKHLPEYPPALLIQGRCAIARGSVSTAVPFLERAAKANPLPEYEWWLYEALLGTGNRARADVILRQLQSQGSRADPRTYSLMLATLQGAEHGAAKAVQVDFRPQQPAADFDPQRAVRLARAEMNTRQDVLTHDALAWALFVSEDLAGARQEIAAATVDGTPDARIFLHAGLIARAAGEPDRATSWLRRCAPSALLPSEASLLRRALTALANPAGATPATTRAITPGTTDPLRAPKPLRSQHTQ